MRFESELWKFALGQLEKGNDAVLLVVAESTGSSPGRAGFKMVVATDGMRGSVGGGVMEVELVKSARQTLESEIRNQKSKIVRLVHLPNVPDASGMICSGRQTVIHCTLDPNDLETVRTICGALDDSRKIGIGITGRGLHVTDVAAASDILFRFGEKVSHASPGEPSIVSSAEFEYEEPLGRKRRLFIVGGGHCALALSELMSRLDFRIALFDDRAELNTLEKNTFADDIMVIDSYDAIGRLIPEGDDVFVVVMTLGYKFDEIVIRRLFEKNFRYFGVLGSRAKMRTLLNSLKSEGFDTDRLKRIRTPIGLPINSRTPEEIAVSIAAEIVAVKNHAAKME